MDIKKIINKILVFFGFRKSQITPLTNQYSSIPNNGKYVYSNYENDVIDLINEYRLTIGFNSLIKVDYVSLICEIHNKEMVIDGKPSHNGFVGRSEIIFETLGAKKVGENVAFNYYTAMGVFKAWLKSPEHRKNIEGQYTHIGISILDNNVDNNYFTTIFIKK